MNSSHCPRLRIFAGPNGSGKSTLIRVLKEEVNLYKIINPDDLSNDLENNRSLDLSAYGIQATSKKFHRFVKNSTYEKNIITDLLNAQVDKNNLQIGSIRIDPYKVALIAAFIRDRMLKRKISFSFETVFSHPSKVEFLKKADQAGYHNYLYFIATEDTVINIGRVDLRVAEGGHSVPKNKIISRYYRSLDNLFSSLKYTHRAYIFDNSGKSSRLVAEVTPHATLLLRTQHIPIWFDNYVIQKLT